MSQQFSTKDRVLAMLLRSEEFLSGAAIGEALKVSRSAVNKAVSGLREEGYELASVTNRGYRLVSCPDYVRAGELLALLPEERMKNIVFFDETDSTNNRLMDLYFDGAMSGTVVLADSQTKGRAKDGASFDSPRGGGVYLSYLIRPKKNQEAREVIQAAGVAATAAIEKAAGVKTSLRKNAILRGEAKVGGILTELLMEAESGRVETIICGIGIHVKKRNGPCLEEATAGPVRRAVLAAALIKELDRAMK